MKSLVLTEEELGMGGERLLHVQLNAPRSNALEPRLITALHDALDRVEADGYDRILVSSGPNFSTGGDVVRFLEAARKGEGAVYAQCLVPRLQELVMRFVTLPSIVAVAARGAITGGAAGLLFSADLAVLHPQAFVQPYYGRVGFAPDGGWTSTLPARIGAGPALTWLLTDWRADADALVQMGLAAEVSEVPENRALDLLTSVDVGSALASKALIWNAERRAELARALALETEQFIKLVGRPETCTRMESFLNIKARENV